MSSQGTQPPFNWQYLADTMKGWQSQQFDFPVIVRVTEGGATQNILAGSLSYEGAQPCIDVFIS